jgi:hypothetical protein
MPRWQAARRAAPLAAATIPHVGRVVTPAKDRPHRVTAIGIVAGVGPANQAAALEPASALRYE